MGLQTSPPVPSVVRTNEPGIHDNTQRPGVMARLHALFPNHTVESTQDSRRTPPKFLKIRMLTWNMHDSLPKGDLDELLGPIYDYDEQAASPGALPDLPLTSQHPYHLIVVAGQECPSVSGIPMALGAGFKLKDKEKERERSKEKDKDMPGEQHPDLEKSRDEDEDRRKSRHLSMRRLSHQRPQTEEEELVTSASASTHDLLLSHHPPYGWTSMLEDWFCNGVHAMAPVHPTAQDVNTDSEPQEQSEVPIPPKAKSTGDLNGRIQPPQKGPYELLIKERMMGLYLAVFIKRDVRNLVRGMSKSSVTAGLIGGRVGNKGGVGISLNLHGTTFLFLNAHLAAHEGKVQNRLANLTKIKSELAVETFLAPDDPRIMAEDITDRFDFAFICGDLNFRLDVTRLHADWLISRREYARALAFDQLRKAMETGVAFVGFKEAPIDFPPTFKYDVLRSKRSKHRSLKRISRNLGIDGTQHEKLLTEIEEHRQDAEEDKSDDEPEYDGEAASVTSTNYTQYTTDGEDQERDQEDDFVGTSVVRTISASNLTNKEWYNAAAQKAKTKWISLLSTSVPKTPMGKWAKFKNRQSGMSNSSYDPSPSPSLTGSPAPEFRSAAFPPTPDLSEGGTSKELDGRYFGASRSGGSSELGRLSAPITVGGRTSSTRSTARSEDKEYNEETKFNYDSSHKKRVPSWCDRILWKSTAQPSLEPIQEDDEPPPLPPRRRMGSLLSALRPASLRSRKDSTASTDITPTSPYHTDDAASSRSSPYDIDSNAQAALDSPPTPRSRPLTHSKSIEFAASSERPFMSRSKSHMLLREERNRKPSLPSLTNIQSPTLPPSRPQELKDMLAAATSSKEMLPSPAPTTSLWRNLSLFPFLSRDNTPQNTPTDRPPTPESPMPDPRRGDVICLSYDTLDDMAMRRLQAKSDHRPVIGTYAIYV